MESGKAKGARGRVRKDNVVQQKGLMDHGGGQERGQRRSSAIGNHRASRRGAVSVEKSSTLRMLGFHDICALAFVATPAVMFMDAPTAAPGSLGSGLVDEVQNTPLAAAEENGPASCTNTCIEVVVLYLFSGGTLNIFNIILLFIIR